MYIYVVMAESLGPLLKIVFSIWQPRWTVADALQLTTGHDRGFYCVFFTFWGNNYNGQKSISIGS